MESWLGLFSKLVAISSISSSRITPSDGTGSEDPGGTDSEDPGGTDSEDPGGTDSEDPGGTDSEDE